MAINIMEDIDEEDYRKPSGDDGEIVFSQKEKGAATLGPYGLTADRQSEWLRETEPHHGARPRIVQEGRPTMEVDQEVDSVVGATGGTTGQNIGIHGTPARRCLRNNKSCWKMKFERHHDGNRVEMEVNDRRNPGYPRMGQRWFLEVLRIMKRKWPVETGKVTSGHQG